MDPEATPGGTKRTFNDFDDGVTTPATLKKRRIDQLNGAAKSPSTPKALDAITSAIGSVFGYNRPSPQPNGDAPPTDGVTGDAIHAQPATSSAPAVAATPPKPRPAIKLAALRGTKWDTGEAKSPSPKKKTPTPKRMPSSYGNKSALSRATATENQATSPGRTLGWDAGDEYDVENEHENSPSVMRSIKRPLGTSHNGNATNGTQGSEYDFAVEDSPSKRKFMPAPKGILTPTKKRGGPKLPKSVSFGGNSKEEVFFEDIKKTPIPAKKRGRPPKKKPEEEVVDDIVCAICSRPDSKDPNQIILCDNCDFAVHQECYDVPEIPTGDWLCKSCAQEDVLKTPSKPVEEGAVVAKVAVAAEVPDIANLDKHVRSLQRVLLNRCVGKRRVQMFGQQEAYDKARQLVEQTVLAGEGNSMLLIGPRGCGKTTLVENVVADLSQEHRHEFHVVRLSGFIHTDDKLALKEIWRQLGKEMEVEDDLINRSNYADTMASLLALLSHPSEISGTADGVTSQSVVFVIDEFDMFAAHPRQTLLYNLFDIAQSRKAPVAVLGCTTRLDVVEMLEKRVKSRFSHRYVYLSLPKTLPAFWQVCRQGLMMDKSDAEKEGIDVALGGYDEFWKYWSHKIEQLYKQRAFQDLLQYHYYTTKSASAFFAEWILPLSSLSATNLTLEAPATGAETTSLTPPDSRLQLLPALSDLDLSLLIAAARLDIVAHTDTVNFAMAYDEYSSLVGRQRVQSATSGMLAVGGGARAWSRGVAGISWERLVSLGLLVPAGFGGGGVGSRAMAGGHGGLDGKMWKVDVALEEIPSAVKLNNMLAKWCKEI